MKKAHHSTKKHAGSHKHHASGKHHPSHHPVHHHHVGGTHHPSHSHVVGKHHKHTKPAKWSPMDDIACCAAQALAASLRLTGRRVTDADILDLYWRTAGHADAGATLADTIAAAAEYGLGGVRLADARPTIRLGDGVVIGADLTERHAMTMGGHGVWTWGQWLPASCNLLGAVDEAWELTWL